MVVQAAFEGLSLLFIVDFVLPCFRYHLLYNPPRTDEVKDRLKMVKFYDYLVSFALPSTRL